MLYPCGLGEPELTTIDDLEETVDLTILKYYEIPLAEVLSSRRYI